MTTVQPARVHANGIEIAYETFGDPAGSPVVMIMGLGTQMIAWPDEVCADLAGRGHYVVRFDNRDVGLSTHLPELGVPSLRNIVLPSAPAYSIDDMADDTAGLLDALDLRSAHIVGASMGGFIAQALAIRRPDQVRSLTLIMTSTGSKLVGNPKPRTIPKLLRRPRVRTREEAIASVIETFSVIGSPGYPLDVDYLRGLAEESFDRSADSQGYLRQLAAIRAQPNRTRKLRRLRTPTLVMHGLHDPLVGVSGGLALARVIPGAQFTGFAGMGHDLPRALWPRYAEEIAAVVERGGG